ncbi:uncharacterized protein KY384_002066 [Bacidia gigantensis]|uniref:uncharacterized protein n=1 Tax=Bacidia gigantensis TaxID=2732470 RepID=UPI001D05BCD3|nr:uncharacterized protein KY384_002066 [Bacidia gigantensis]KAG8533283.1 hypothetical protein KY384_002066 [Bacidia gigantensis]
MILEDFEKTLADSRKHEEHRGHKEHKHRHHRRRHHDEDQDRHRHKKRKQSGDDAGSGPRRRHNSDEGRLAGPDEDIKVHEEELATAQSDSIPKGVISDEQPKRDSWMQGPSSLDVDYIQSNARESSEIHKSKSSRADFELKIHEKELNKHHLKNVSEGKDIPDEILHEPAQYDVDYEFGDSGASWRMTRLRGVYRRAQEEQRALDDVAKKQYGNLRLFDNAREEQTELERRETYGEGYVGKAKPSGDLFAERKVESGLPPWKRPDDTQQSDTAEGIKQVTAARPAQSMVHTDQSVLNRLKAQMMKAKFKGGSEAAKLEEEYDIALAGFTNQKQPAVVVLGAMENRMLAGGRKGEVKPMENKRGRERGLVAENEDMTIEDMVREERRTKAQAGGDGRRFAERIAKDGKFDNDLEYMDENAAKLAKRVQKSDINLRNIAISDFQKINKILDSCPLCYHEDQDRPPVAPVVSLATRTYLTLPTEPELSDGGACIVPIQHRDNLLHCDDDEWEEIRNFMKSLIRMYHDQGRDVIFYENAAAPHRKRHASMEVVPLPYSLGDTAPAFFKEAMLTADEEWTQHKKIIDTLLKAKDGLGKAAFRRTLAKEMPYFHVWFEMNGGIGHVVEDSNRWPKGDLFAREVIGGMLDKGADVIRRQGKWHRGQDARVEGFRRRWKAFDWTRVLQDG